MKLFEGKQLEGLVLTNGLMIKDATPIIDGLAVVTLDDATERVWISDLRLKEYAPDDITVEDNFSDIENLDALLKWYDVEWEVFDAFSGRYRLKPVRHDESPHQCWVRVAFKDGTEKRWTALCNDQGDIQRITTDDGTHLKTLAEFRATGIVDATLINEYNIIDL